MNHLCFADEIILCSRWDFVFVYSLFQCFKHFSEVSGLEANENKTEMYTFGMKQDVIQNVTGFKVGSFHFTYLGVQLVLKEFQ